MKLARPQDAEHEASPRAAAGVPELIDESPVGPHETSASRIGCLKLAWVSQNSVRLTNTTKGRTCCGFQNTHLEQEGRTPSSASYLPNRACR